MREEKMDEYMAYLFGAANFYGVVELDEFTDAYIDEKEQEDFYDLFFCSYEEKVIRAFNIKDMYYLSCYDKDGTKECLRQQGKKKLKVISKTELGKYGNPNYYPETALSDLLERNGVDKERIVEIIGHLASIYCNHADVFKILAEDIGGDLEELLKILNETYNNLPLHANKGYSPNEMAEMGVKVNDEVNVEVVELKEKEEKKWLA